MGEEAIDNWESETSWLSDEPRCGQTDAWSFSYEDACVLHSVKKTQVHEA